MNQKRFVYVDNAATTRISDKVLGAMLPYLRESYGNPSGIYRLGREARKAVETAREQVAKALGAQPREIFFTSGGTESDNWAVKMAARGICGHKKKHIVTSVFEHPAVLDSVRSLEEEGFKAAYISVGEKGIVDPADVEKAIMPETALVSIMYANNEIGTIQPAAEIGRICREKGVLFHTDAVQAAGNISIDVVEQRIDLLSLSGHKIRAPKGVGALYIREGSGLSAYIHGGRQEKGLRSGTENVAAIVGFGAAMQEAVNNMDENNAKIKAMRDKLLGGICALPRIHLNGCIKNRLPGNINLSIEGTEGEAMTIMLDINGISVSSGSACSTGQGASHVLGALGLSEHMANAALRITINEENTMEDMDYILETLSGMIKKLREQSPLWERITRQDSMK